MLRKFLAFTSVRALISSSKGVAGYNLLSNETKTIREYGSEVMKTDIGKKIPKGSYRRIAPRLNLVFNYETSVVGAVIDSDFAGEVKVIIFNHSSKSYELRFGDRIAQIIFEKVELLEVVEVDELPQTGKGEKGFGSTGK